jgi:hypothetical protein
LYNIEGRTWNERKIYGGEWYSSKEKALFNANALLNSVAFRGTHIVILHDITNEVLWSSNSPTEFKDVDAIGYVINNA